jgi:hypothetical protein
VKGQNLLFHYSPEACGKRYAARFRELGGALYEVHRLPREVLQKRDRYRTSTKFRLEVIRFSPQTFQMALIHVLPNTLHNFRVKLLNLILKFESKKPANSTARILGKGILIDSSL